MRFSIFAVVFGLFCILPFQSGCDRPAHEPNYYGKVINHLPDLPEVKEPFDIPEIEGVDREYLLKRYR